VALCVVLCVSVGRGLILRSDNDDDNNNKRKGEEKEWKERKKSLNDTVVAVQCLPGGKRWSSVQWVVVCRQLLWTRCY
jgi:hypothetical protein